MTSSRPYLSGPHVFTETVIEKIRGLPPGAKVLVKPGDPVAPDTVVAHLNPGGYLHFVNVAEELDVAYHLAAHYVVKAEGDSIRRGETVAARPAALGLLLAECRSPSDGVIEKIYPSGHVAVRSYPVPVAAFVRGRVLAAVDGSHLSILTAGLLVQGVFGLGGERYGPLHVRPAPGDSSGGGIPLGDSRDGGIPPGAIVVEPGRAEPDLLRRCREAGAAALVAASCRWVDLKASGLIQRPGGRPAPAGAGHPGAPLTVVLIEGFGGPSLPPTTRSIFRLLAAHHGREASVSGHTQLRAGVERPELIVPDGPAPATPAEADGSAVRVGRRTLVYLGRTYDLPRLETGARVRLVRAPYAGLEGVIEELPPRPGRIATGAVLPVAVVRLDDGRRVTAPRCNLVSAGGERP